jgi:DNA-directed RNA polymerase subunit N (RpoN/RPB10)
LFSTPLPTHEDKPGTVTNVCQDRTSLWFCPATSQSALDILRDNLDQVSTNLTPLCVPHLFPGKLCAAKFTADCGMYRARVIELRGEDRSSILSRMGEMKRFCCLRDTLSMSDVEEIEVSIMWRMLPQFGDHSCNHVLGPGQVGGPAGVDGGAANPLD